MAKTARKTSASGPRARSKAVRFPPDMLEEIRVLRKAAREASRAAVRETFALGLPVTYLKRGRLVHEYPDGTIVPVSDAEIAEITGRKGR